MSLESALRPWHGWNVRAPDSTQGGPKGLCERRNTLLHARGVGDRSPSGMSVGSRQSCTLVGIKLQVCLEYMHMFSSSGHAIGSSKQKQLEHLLGGGFPGENPEYWTIVGPTDVSPKNWTGVCSLFWAFQ